MYHGRKIAAGACAALFLVTGCGKAIEKAAEKATGCSKISADSGGQVNCKGTSYSANGTAKLPSGWPSDLKPPSGTKIYTSTATTSNGVKTYAITASLKGTTDEVSKGLKKQLTSAGYKIENDSVSTGSAGASGSISATNKDFRVDAGFGQNTTNPKDGGAYVIMTVTELTAEEKAAAATSTSDTASTSDTSSSSSSADTSSTSDTGSSSDSGSSSTGGTSTVSGQSLPAGFPKELDPPKGAVIVSGIKTTQNGKDQYLVSAGVSGSVKDVYDGLKKQLTSAGYTISADSLTTAGADSYGAFEGTKGSRTVNVVIASDSSGTSGKPTSVTLTVSG